MSERVIPIVAEGVVRLIIASGEDVGREVGHMEHGDLREIELVRVAGAFADLYAHAEGRQRAPQRRQSDETAPVVPHMRPRKGAHVERILAYIGEHPGARQSEIREALGLTTKQVSNTLGYQSRRTPPTLRRRPSGGWVVVDYGNAQAS